MGTDNNRMQRMISVPYRCRKDSNRRDKALKECKGLNDVNENMFCGWIGLGCTENVISIDRLAESPNVGAL